jgi:hypothetical protein
VRLVLLLTATVDVKGIGFMAISDPAQRLQQYATAVAFWARVGGFDGIVFCENSGHDISGIRAELAASRTPSEVVQYEGQGFDRSLGKGFGELSAMQRAARSPLLESADLVLKVNGRYVIPNATALARDLRALWPTDVVADLHQSLRWADSRIFAFTPAFLRDYFAPRLASLDDSKGVYFEHGLANAIHAALADDKRWCPVPGAPEIEGRSGTLGSSHRLPAWRRMARPFYRRLYRLMLTR